MAVYRACYCTRLDVKSALDVEQTADYDAQIDSALAAGSDDVDALCHRRFYNVLETHYWDWPNFQRAYPWRIWFDEAELADVTVNPPVVTTGGTVIPDSAIFWGDANYPTAPYNHLELDRSQSYAFGVGATPQRNIVITGLYGYWLQTRPAGSLAAAVSSSTATTITGSDASGTGLSVGDVLTVDSEAMLVQDCALADTGQQQTGGGCSTAADNDNVLEVASGAALHKGEIIVLDSESMLVQTINGNNATVVRSYDGSQLSTHSDAEVYAYRSLTVQRGFGGTTAATHSNSETLTAALVPGQVHELALAEACNYVLQKTSGYARTIGENMTIVPGGSLPDLRNRVYARFGRKGRTRVV
jgi:hypothetical protein